MPITKEFYVELDLKLATGNRDFTLVEGDTGNVIHVTLKDDGTPVDLTGCRVLAVFTKPTGSSMQDSAIEGGGVTLGGDDGNEVTIELFAASFGTGTNACELQIYSGTEMDVLVTSAAFNFYCRNGIIDDNTITSTDEYPLLTSLISQVQALEDAVLTPSDVDGALSATSENPVQNKTVKLALDGKAPSAHTHVIAGITDFPSVMPPTAHTHAKTEITDFPATMAPSAHAHGNISSNGCISGAPANYPIFTGQDGLVQVILPSEARTILDAAAASHTHNRIQIGGFGTLLWSGSWWGGSIVVPGATCYISFLLFDGYGIPMWACNWDGTLRGGGIAYGSIGGANRQLSSVIQGSCSGNTWTMSVCGYHTHVFSGSHGNWGANGVGYIWGIC